MVDEVDPELRKRFEKAMNDVRAVGEIEICEICDSRLCKCDIKDLKKKILGVQKFLYDLGYDWDIDSDIVTKKDIQKVDITKIPMYQSLLTNNEFKKAIGMYADSDILNEFNRNNTIKELYGALSIVRSEIKKQSDNLDRLEKAIDELENGKF